MHDPTDHRQGLKWSKALSLASETICCLMLIYLQPLPPHPASHTVCHSHTGLYPHPDFCSPVFAFSYVVLSACFPPPGASF